MSKLKPIPEFATDEEFGKFWMEHDTTEYIDWSKAERPNRERAFLNLEISIPKAEYSTLSKLAEQKKSSLTDLVASILHNGIEDMLAHPSS